jgi:hypothetical protein
MAAILEREQFEMLTKTTTKKTTNIKTIYNHEAHYNQSIRYSLHRFHGLGATTAIT